MAELVIKNNVGLELLMKCVVALSLGLLFVLQVAPSAEAKLGSGLAEAVRAVRGHKSQVSAATYFIKSGQVVAENVTAEEAGWSQVSADRIRMALVGPRKLKSKFMDGGTPTYLYSDGTKVTYQLGDGDRIMGLEATIGKYANTVMSKYQGFQEVYDAKDHPWNGRPW